MTGTNAEPMYSSYAYGYGYRYFSPEAEKYARSAKKFPLSMMEHRYCNAIDYMERQFQLGLWFLRLSILRNIKRRIVDWYHHHILQSGVLIIRNRRDKKPDIRLQIQYHPIRDGYFAAAFSMNFMKDIEDGCLVVHTAREGTSQEAVLLYWTVFRKLGRKMAKDAIHAFLEEKKNAGHLEEGINVLLSIAGKWDESGRFEEIVLSYLEDYMNATLYNHGYVTLERLRLFIERDPILAEYIWKANFNTRKARQRLLDILKIALRHQKAFLEADNIDALRLQIDCKIRRRMPSDQYDLLPDHFKTRITKAQADVTSAKKGIRVGFRGRYIDSEAIAIAQSRLDTLWKEADRWIGLHLKNKHRG